MSPTSDVTYTRGEPRPTDDDAVRDIVASTQFFHDHEVEVAVELVRERREQGLASGYLFRFVDGANGPIGYACYGEVPCTRGSYDLYWIAVHREQRGRGIGRRLLDVVEEDIRDLGGRRIWIETSARPLYAPTAAFYRACGYDLVASLPEFYDPGDDKLVFGKAL